jgi:gluconolactonase
MAAGPSIAARRLDLPFRTHDPAFADVLGDAPRLLRVVDTDAHEGPVYVAGEDALYFTTVPAEGRVAVRRLALHGDRFPLTPERVSTVRADTDRANGMVLGLDGRLLVCEQGTFERPARIARLDPATGETETVVDAWRDLPLNSPNDVVVSRDGAVWFTDPSYGFLQGFRPEPQVADAVYRFDPATGVIEAVAAGFDKPNGLAFSPDERVLYVSDNGEPHELLALDVGGDRGAGPAKWLADGTPGHPDGLKVDAAGRIYASATTGVHVFDPSGLLLGEIQLPGAVNFCFGGPARNVLHITTDTAVWAAVLNAKGA